MARANRPATPLDEIAARRGWRGATMAGGVLTGELVAFCESGTSILIGSAEPGGRPVAGQALACRVRADGMLHVLLRAPGNEPVLELLRAGAPIAVTFSEPHSHRSIQLKGTSAVAAPVAEGDLAVTTQQSTHLRAELVDVGYPQALATAYCAFERHEIVAIDFLPDSAFVQTPGPHAGSALEP